MWRISEISGNVRRIRKRLNSWKLNFVRIVEF